MSYDQFVAKVDNGTITPSEHPNLTVTHDMGWQKKGSRRTCDSLSCHASMIGGHSGKVIGGLIMGKIYAMCQRAAKLGKEAAPHEHPGQHEGSSKGMEADAALKLVV